MLYAADISARSCFLARASCSFVDMAAVEGFKSIDIGKGREAMAKYGERTDFFSQRLRVKILCSGHYPALGFTAGR